MSKKTFTSDVSNVLSQKKETKTSKEKDARATLILSKSHFDSLKLLAWIKRGALKKEIENAIEQYINTKRNKELIAQAIEVQKKIK